MVRTTLVASLLVLFALPASAQSSENECVRRFDACAVACAALGRQANDGCLGACLIDNGCPIDEDGGTQSSNLPGGGLPDDALPDSTLPDNSLPDGTLPDSRLP